MIKYKQIIGLFFLSPFIIANSIVEEIVTTGSLINNPEEDTSPVNLVTKEDFEKF
jgi:hypothetical protein